jgi:hypothetical protein
MSKFQGTVYVSKSGNSKTGHADVTYSAISKTCPNSCELKGKGCYAETGNIYFTLKRIEESGKDLSAYDIARQEAKAIDSSYNGKAVPGTNLRLHVSGDSRTVKGTRVLADAVRRWKVRGGNKVWTYTHAWKNVPRYEWGPVSVLGSISKASEAKKVQEQGYAPALVVSEHKSDKVYLMEGSDVNWIPCPAQVRDDVTCSDCQLCMKGDELYKKNIGIAFSAHGAKKNSLKKHLQVIQ